VLRPRKRQLLKTDSIVETFAGLSEAEREALISGALQATEGMRWLPLPGAQTAAFFSEADLLLYGGSAGSSKSDLLLGLAFTSHRHSMFVRRQFTDLGAGIKRAREIAGPGHAFNGAPPARLTLGDRTLEFFGCHMNMRIDVTVRYGGYTKYPRTVTSAVTYAAL
jgi:hypothetical protein